MIHSGNSLLLRNDMGFDNPINRFGMNRNLLFNSANPFTPASIQTYGWYDPSDTATITHSANRVSRIADVLGRTEVDLTQGTAARQMITNTNTIGGRNTVTSDAVARFIDNGTLDFTASAGSVAFHIVVNPNPPFSNTRDSLMSLGGTGFEFRGNSTTNFDGIIAQFGFASGGVVMTSTPHNTPMILSTVFDWLAQTVTIYKNGVFNVSGGYTLQLSNNANWRLSHARILSTAIIADYGEIVVTGDVTAGTTAGLINYMKNRWGIA